MALLVTSGDHDVHKLLNLPVNYRTSETLHDSTDAFIISVEKLELNKLKSYRDNMVAGGLLLLCARSKKTLKKHSEQFYDLYLDAGWLVTNYIKNISGRFYLYIRAFVKRSSDVPVNMESTTVSVQFFETPGIAKNTLENIDKYTNPDVSMIVLDNECKSDTANIIVDYVQKWKKQKRFRKLKYAVVSKNEGVVPARNIIMELCETQYLIRIFGDILVGEKWVEGFIKAMAAGKNFHAVGATEIYQGVKSSYYVDQSQIINEIGFDEYIRLNNRVLENKKILYTGRSDKSHLHIQPCDHAQIIDIDLYNNIGFYDPIFYPHFFSVTDYVLRAYFKGYIFANTNLVYVMHNPPEDGHKQIMKNRFFKSSQEYFYDKYNLEKHAQTKVSRLLKRIVNGAISTISVLQEESLPSTFTNHAIVRDWSYDVDNCIW